MELAKQIRRYRTEKGLSQEDLAAAIFVSRQTVSNWETDKTYPDVQNLLLLSSLFEVSIDSLIKGDMEAMTKIINEDAHRMMCYAWAGLILALAGVVVFAACVFRLKLDLVWCFAVFAVMYAPAMALLLKVDRMKRDNDLVTYAEIKAFVEGGEVDRDNAHSRAARRGGFVSGALKVASGAVMALVAGALAYGVCVLLGL